MHATGAFPSPSPIFFRIWRQGNALQYAAFVPHDMSALVNEVYPSAAVFAATLEDFHNKSIGWAFNTTFPNPYWWPGNEVMLQPQV